MAQTSTAPRKTTPNPVWTGLVLIAITTAMVLLAWHARPGLNWVFTLALMTAFLVVLGLAITGRVNGILINEMNLMSLSRFQMVLWTVIVVSGYFVIAIARVKAGDVANPLAVAIDWKVWTLLGISTTSLVGSPLIMGNKKRKEPADKAKTFKVAKNAYGEDSAAVEANRSGILYGNKDVSEARFTDMFEGDELANAPLIDVAKVQMFFFTILVAIAYGAELLHVIMVDDLTGDNMSLPVIHEGVLALMGISHAGYLGGKSVTSTPTAS
ncbi:MAG: hypothetical protein OEV08_03715 [Nitrospira sp.]|nr:hypothetical protein [Nitrospira sp.]